MKLLKRAPEITPETPDEALVRRAQAGESAAFRALFERHVVAVRRFLRDLLRNTDAADDATQESFARAHAQLVKLTDYDRFKPWMLGIARNVAYESRRVRQHDVLEEDDDATPAAVIPSPDPEAMLLDAELEKHFTEALGHLSENRRAALLMRLDHGLAYEEIAAAFGWSIPTVKNEIHRARLKLRVHLLPHVTGERP
ncbi:MAG: RNA polymerase sigma factor [Archangium gephyra]|uniref:RNA polymerase sigma factor n=1 Tax=Archangium gephyra TaxID=48 RepID=A0A2W5TI19_9BACT|nr:MAG: RNA polymerase sigma factor [Archangium gephyra]